MTNEEYIVELKARGSLSFVEDCRLTLREIHGALDRQQQDDESPLDYRKRLSTARTKLMRLMLRLQDGRLGAKE